METHFTQEQHDASLRVLAVTDSSELTRHGSTTAFLSSKEVWQLSRSQPHRENASVRVAEACYLLTQIIRPRALWSPRTFLGYPRINTAQRQQVELQRITRSFPRLHFHLKLIFWRGLISLCSYSFWRRSNFFKAVERLQFLTWAELLFFFYSFAHVVCHVHTWLSGRELSTIVEGQTNTCIYTYMCVCICMCVYVCVSVFFLLSGAVSRRVLCVVGCWFGGWVAGWLGVACRCRPWYFLLRMMSILLRARAERSMIERRVGQHMECVVLAPFSKQVRSKGFFGEPLKHVITPRGQILVSRKLAIRDEPNIRLR